MGRIKVKQHDATDCGAACLVSVAAWYHLKLPLARVRQYAATGPEGTTVLGLIQAAGRLGFAAKGVKGELEGLSRIPLPAIAHLVIQESLHHFVVIVEVLDRYLKIMDPADGRIHRVPYTEFGQRWTGVLILLLPDEEFRTGNEKTGAWRRLWLLLQPHRAELLQVLFGAMVYTILGLSTSVFVQKIVDYVLPGGNTGLLNLMGTTMIMFLLLRAFIHHVKTIMTIRIGQRLDARLVLGYCRHLFGLPQSIFDSMQAGELISRMNDAVKIRLFINEGLTGIAVNLLILLFSFGLMFTHYWKLALAMLSMVPLQVLIYYLLNRANRRTQRLLMEHGAGLESQLVESVRAAGTIRRFGLEEFTHLKTESRFIRLLKTVYAGSVNALRAENASSFISSLFTILLLWAGAGFVLQHHITAGELLSFYALFGYFTGPVLGLIGMNRTMQDALIAAERLFEIMDLEPEEKGQKMELNGEIAGPVCFNGVTFRYGTRPALFEGLDLCFNAGTITAVVGESGSGKTTLSSLMQRIYPPETGNITIGDIDIHYIDRRSLRKLIGVVPQQIDLFSGTVLENIAPGTFEPDLKRVIPICQKLGMMDFINAMPLGLEAAIGENGTSLSGGQRQRLAIARALYRNPAVLVFDEATASLDAASEHYVRKTLLSLKEEGKTIIIITHRLSTVTGADKIVVLDKGKVVESGTPADLRKLGGAFDRMWRLQADF